MERIEGNDPSDDGIESPSPSKYAQLFFVIYVTSFPHLNVKLNEETLCDNTSHFFLVAL